MSFETKEAEQEQRLSAELYLFTVPGSEWRWTSYETDLVVSGATYTHKPIKRSEFSVAQKEVAKVRISAPVVDPFTRYIANTPVMPVSVAIKKYYLDDLSDSRLLFSGKIRNVTAKDNVAEAECLSKEYQLQRVIPRVLYQSFCNRELFDERCGKAEVDYEHQAKVNVVGSSIISVEGLGSQLFSIHADGYFKGGYVVFEGDIRYVIKHEGDNLTLQVPFSELQSGDIVSAYPGCDKSPETCSTKFNNLANFLGMPYIPSKSPIIYSIR
jgi:uncharacterized phage protein (TIGR02218 family)